MQHSLQKFWLTKGDQLEEWFRLKFHTYAVTVLSIGNCCILGLPALISWFEHTFNLRYGVSFPLTPYLGRYY